MPNGIKSIMKLSKKQIYVLLISVVLAFILINSMLNGIISQWLSSLPKNFVQSFIPYGKYKWLDEFLIHKIRKCAHFFEYFVLSLLITRFYYTKKANFKRFLNTVFICFSVAFLDETIQLFSHRRSSVLDIWLDLFGAISAILIYKAVCFIAKVFKRRAVKHKGEEND